jgi:hypothetical protein
VGEKAPQIPRDLGGGESDGQWGSRRGNPDREDGRVDCVGGGGEESATGTKLIALFLILLSLLSFVKGDPYPESCTQRTAEGGGSPMLKFAVEDRLLAPYVPFPWCELHIPWDEGF